MEKGEQRALRKKNCILTDLAQNANTRMASGWSAAYQDLVEIEAG